MFKNNFDATYQPLAESLHAKIGTHKVTDDWLVTLSINHLNTIKLEWLDNVHLIYVLPDDAVTRIEKISINTGLRTFLCEGDTPKPSPNGKWIAFIRTEKKEKQLWLMCSDGTDLKQLTYLTNGINFGFYKYNFNLVWSHDSTLIALMYPIGIVKSVIDLIDIKTGQTKRILTTDQFQLRSVSWSLDDKEIFFWKEQTEGESDIKQDQECIQVIRLKDASIRTLAKFDGLQQMLNPVLSPDGKNLAIAYDPDHPYFDTTQHIGIISIFNDSSIKQITHKFKLISQQWSPDSKYIYALRVYGAYKQIYRIDVTKGNVKQITDAPFSIDWRGYTLSPDGTKFAYAAINAHGTQVLRVITADGQLVRDLITIPGTSDDMALSEVREIEWDTINYPVRMRGLLILPLDYQVGMSYPLIIDIHGGGSGASLQLDGAILVSTPLEWQMWAAKGYVVFVPEFRSSGAFGELADTRDHYEQHDLINQDIVDIETGVNKLINDGLIDPERMAVVAHSAGARRANWLVATRHQFRAVISKEGWADELHAVSNPIQAYPLNRVYKHFGGSPQEVPENYLKNSVLHHADSVSIPTLFLMGNPELGGIDFAGTVKLFYDVIQSKNVKTELIFYLDEGHVFEKVSNRLDALKRSQTWIDEHTQSKK